MQDEIELKLAVNGVNVEQLNAILSRFNVIESRTAFLANTYYDTSDQYFSRHKMGLRVRHEGDNYTLTLKTDGKVFGGLHMRPEYDVTLPNAEPDLAQLIRQHDLLITIDQPLQPIFSTDFARRSWLIEVAPASRIEVAFDQGDVIAGETRQPISEIEFEIKTGELTPFFAFVADFLARYQGDVHFSSLSKAKRGYRLAQGNVPQPSDWIERWRDFLHTEKHAEKTPEKLFASSPAHLLTPDGAVGKADVQNPMDFVTALLRYEQDLIEETLALGADFFAADFIKTVERVGAFFNLYHYYEEHKASLATAWNEQASADLTNANADLLAQLHAIIRRHSESKDNASAINALFALIQTPQYAQRMLNLITLTLGE